MSKIPYFLGLIAILGLAFEAAGCGGNPQARSPSEIGAPVQTAQNEPDLVAMVVGTVGRDHITKSGYPLTKIADIIDVFKPDMILLQVRQEPFKKQQLEDASFEMTYVNGVAGTTGVDTEPFDWFKDEDVLPPALPGYSSAIDEPPTRKGKKGDKGPEMRDVRSAAAAAKGKEILDPFNYIPPPDIDPDMLDAYKSDSMMPNIDGLSFDDANNDDTTRKIWDAMSARIRYTKGYSPLARRIAWMNYLAFQTYSKQKGQVHRLMIVVNVRYRAPMQDMVAGWGAVLRNPVAVQKKVEQQHETVPDNVIQDWNHQSDRLKDEIPRHGPEALRQNILERIAIIQAAIDKKGTCCIDGNTLGPLEPQ
ncbi:MAG: hypothetical protein ACRELY_16520 [Polyangiaceae bacterium]